MNLYLTTFNHQFDLGDTVYVRYLPGCVARGTVEGVTCYKDRHGTELRYLVKLPELTEEFAASGVFATATEAFP